MLQTQAQTQAQDSTKAWKFSGTTKISLGSIALSNWSAGGENALSALFSMDYQYNYLKDDSKWDNRLILLYGTNKQGTNDFEKTDDRIDLTSIYGYRAHKDWFYALEVNFRTQFAEGKADGGLLGSKFMAPGYLTVSPGMEYSPNENFKVNISPISSKITFVQHDSLSLAGAYGVDPGENMRFEFGAYVNLNWKYDFNEHFYMEHLLRLYSNYLENPQNIDIDWTAKLGIKATKYLTVDFLVQAIYDDDIKFVTETGGEGARLQLKSMLGIGLVYEIQ
jgi:hypothetical protein